MHVALTVGTFDLSGGIERVAVALGEAYLALGHEVTVLATDWDRRYEDRFRFERVDAPAGPAWWRTLRLPPATARQLARGRYDFVHGHGTSTLACDLLTYHTVHAAWLEVSTAAQSAPKAALRRLRPFHRAAIAMERKQAATHRGLFHTCSRAVREELIRHYGVAPERVAAIPWGVDAELFKPAPETRARLRAEWGVRPDQPVLLLVANEFHRKGLGVLLEAMTRWRSPDGILVVAGRTPIDDYRPQIERLGLQQRVRYLGHQPPAPLYASADLFVMPTRYEGWALVIGEALASGLPVLTTPYAGSSDLIRHGQNGWLLGDPDDLQGLVALLDGISAPGELARVAANARPSVADASWTEVGRRLLAWGTGGTV